MKKSFTLILIIVAGFLSSQIDAQPCSDLFISEYIEGSSYNKVIEIYNPTTGTITLDGYQLLLFSNGAPADSPSFKFKLHGLLPTHDVYIISHPAADSVNVLPLVDTTNLVCNWNGNDAVALVKYVTQDTLDIIGIIGEDPGDSWEVGSGSTQDHSLVRMIDVQNGTTNWSQGSTEWNVFAQNDFSNLGFHDMNACAITIPELAIYTDTTDVPENVGTFSVMVSILNPNANATSADVVISGGSAAQGDDYLFTNQTVTFPALSSTPISLIVNVVNDAQTEPDEIVEFSLQDPTNGATISASSVTVKILDDDGLGTGINTLSQMVTVFPNPAADEFHITSVQVLDEIRLESIFGERVMTVSSDDKQQLTIHTGSLPSGLYLLKILSGDSIFVKEVVIKK